MAILLRLISMASLVAGWETAASAQDAAVSAQAAQNQEFLEAVEKAPVFFDGLPIFELRGSLAVPAQQRAQAVSERLSLRRAIRRSIRPNRTEAGGRSDRASGIDGLPARRL